MTKNGHDQNDKYDRVVRELASVTSFQYPETQEDIQIWKLKLRDFIIQKSKSRQNDYSFHNNNNKNNKKNNKKNNNNKDNVHVVNGRYQYQNEQSSYGSNHNGHNDIDVESNLSTSKNKNASASASASASGHAGHKNDNDNQSPLQRRTSTSTSTSTSSAPNLDHQQQKIITQRPPQSITRPWMILGPYDWGYCEKSNLPKPPRSHFDFVTRSLVLNMDHYCPWMFNVGKFESAKEEKDVMHCDELCNNQYNIEHCTYIIQYIYIYIFF
jgi:hypothetical protein